MNLRQRVLVTGGAGFLGSRLVAALAARGARVAVLDDLSALTARGARELTPGAREPGLGAHAPALPRGVELHVADVRDASAVARAARGADLVLHLASVVGVDAVTADPARTESVLREGTRAVLARALPRRCPLVFFSSSEVTDAPRAGPRAVYARAKLAAERELLAHAHRLPVSIVRPFNVVGPGQPDGCGMVLPALAAAARAGRPLPVHGDGLQRRAFLHVDDLVEAVLALVDAGCAPPGGEVLEIGGTERVSILGVAEQLLRAAGGGALALAPAPAPREDLPRRAPDLRALRRRIRFRPRRPLARILSEVLVDEGRRRA